MTVLALFMLLVFYGGVLSDGDLQLVPCASNDIECVSNLTERFIEQTHKGIPAYNILAIDPLFIPSFDVEFQSEGLIYKHKNVTVTGLKNQKLSDFKMDTAANSMVLTLKTDITIIGDITAIFTESSKSIYGHYTSHGSVLNTATYGYVLKKDKFGVEHFDVGPETITCEIVDTPKLELNPELVQTVSNDADFKKLSQAKKDELREINFCKIAVKAFTYAIHNVRVAAKILPASAFFSNLN